MVSIVQLVVFTVENDMPRMEYTTLDLNMTEVAELIGIPDSELRCAIGLPFEPTTTLEQALAQARSTRPNTPSRYAAIREVIAHFVRRS